METTNNLSGMDRRIQRKQRTTRRLAWLPAAITGAPLPAAALISAVDSSTVQLEGDCLTISRVTSGAFQEHVPLSDIATALKTIYSDAAIDGRVAEAYTEKASMLDIGDTIPRLDDINFRQDIMYWKAQLFEQINNLRNTRLAIEQRSLELRAKILDVDRHTTESRREYNRGGARQPHGQPEIRIGVWYAEELS